MSGGKGERISMGPGGFGSFREAAGTQLSLSTAGRLLAR